MMAQEDWLLQGTILTIDDDGTISKAATRRQFSKKSMTKANSFIENYNIVTAN
jgi:hypothetical protein